MANKIENKKDNWKDRITKMICASCIFFVPKSSSGQDSIGRCRKHSPTLNGWPAVFLTDWCGDHKLDENKIE